jgi:hypothetical protein
MKHWLGGRSFEGADELFSVSGAISMAIETIDLGSGFPGMDGETPETHCNQW